MYCNKIPYYLEKVPAHRVFLFNKHQGCVSTGQRQAGLFSRPIVILFHEVDIDNTACDSKGTTHNCLKLSTKKTTGFRMVVFTPAPN